MDDLQTGMREAAGATLRFVPAPSPRRASLPAAEVFLPRFQAEDFLLVHIANLLEQDRAPGGGPGVHLSRCASAAKLIQTRAPYLLQHVSGDLGLHDELHLRDLYEECLASLAGDEQIARERLASAQRIAPFLPELAAIAAALASDPTQRARLAAEAAGMFAKRGVLWDKRLTWEEWIGVAEGRLPLHRKLSAVPESSAITPLPYRFYQYLWRISQGGAGQMNTGWYPGLTSSPIHDPTTIPLSRALEANFDTIKGEIRAVSDEHFHSEAEPIGRTGRWEVLMLFETGKKQIKNCERMPFLTELLESSSDVRTSAGLIYLSRLKPHTTIAPHRGGTNSRLRLHLGIDIPEGDCGMRVKDRVLSWQVGKALVFDDFYEHEVWNNTDDERLVLLIDIWHPELTEPERVCLDAISKQVSSQAASRARYWNTNNRQRKREADQRAQQPARNESAPEPAYN